MSKLIWLFVVLNTVLLGCVSMDNHFLELKNRWLETVEQSYGSGNYFQFQAFNFSETSESHPSLERLKKLIKLFKNKPEECKKHMEIIDESRNLYEGGNESIYVRCGRVNNSEQGTGTHKKINQD